MNLSLRFVNSLTSVLVLADLPHNSCFTTQETMHHPFHLYSGALGTNDDCPPLVMYTTCNTVKFPMTIDVAVSFGLCNLFKLDV